MQWTTIGLLFRKMLRALITVVISAVSSGAKETKSTVPNFANQLHAAKNIVTTPLQITGF
jgi:hypothetical protein